MYHKTIKCNIPFLNKIFAYEEKIYSLAHYALLISLLNRRKKYEFRKNYLEGENAGFKFG